MYWNATGMQSLLGARDVCPTSSSILLPWADFHITCRLTFLHYRPQAGDIYIPLFQQVYMTDNHPAVTGGDMGGQCGA